MFKILIVDDDIELLKIYERAFLNANFSVDKSQNIAEAENLIKVNKYDLILLDLLFPSTDILPTIRSIRFTGSMNSKTPILVLTNLDPGEKTNKALGYGANELLYKANETPKSIVEAAVKLIRIVNNGENN